MKHSFTTKSDENPMDVVSPYRAEFGTGTGTTTGTESGMLTSAKPKLVYDDTKTTNASEESKTKKYFESIQEIDEDKKKTAPATIGSNSGTFHDVIDKKPSVHIIKVTPEEPLHETNEEKTVYDKKLLSIVNYEGGKSSASNSKETGARKQIKPVSQNEIIEDKIKENKKIEDKSDENKKKKNPDDETYFDYIDRKASFVAHNQVNFKELHDVNENNIKNNQTIPGTVDSDKEFLHAPIATMVEPNEVRRFESNIIEETEGKTKSIEPSVEHQKTTRLASMEGSKIENKTTATRHRGTRRDKRIKTQTGVTVAKKANNILSSSTSEASRDTTILAKKRSAKQEAHAAARQLEGVNPSAAARPNIAHLPTSTEDSFSINSPNMERVKRTEKRSARRETRTVARQIKGQHHRTKSMESQDDIEVDNEDTIVGAMAITQNIVENDLYDSDDSNIYVTSSDEEGSVDMSENDDDITSVSIEGTPAEDYSSAEAPILQAYMVNDEEDHLVATAEPMPEENKRRRYTILCLVISVISGIVAGVSVFVTKRKSIKSTSASTLPPTMEPSSVPSSTPTISTQGLIDLISNTSVDGGKSLERLGSPQQKALQWLEENNTYLDRYTDGQILQRYSLATLFFATTGEAWIKSDNWLTDQNECEWYPNGTLCPFGDNTISHLLFSENGLRGLIPPEISFLSSDLTEIDFSGNKLIGNIPSTIGRLTNLVRLKLDENDFTGSLPTSLGHATKLEYLDLNLNKLSGSIPTEIGLLKNLQLLDITNTWIYGTLPTELGHLRRMEFLFFGGSMLSGSLMTEIGHLSKLRTLNINDASLTGTLPSEVGLLTNLKVMNLHINHLSGTIPNEIGNASMLETLDVHLNKLTGSIPTSIGLLTELTFWDMTDGNNFSSGTLPTEIGHMTKLQFLTIPYAGSGALASEIGQLTNLRILHIERTMFTGMLPSEVGRLSNLRSMKLTGLWSGYGFIGPIPVELSNLSNLQELSLHRNSLNGTILEGLSNFTILEVLDLSSNRLSGNVPSEIGFLTSLTELDLSTNRFSGSLPLEFSLLTTLQVLELNVNALSGTLYGGLFENLTELRELNLQDNDLTGTIPPEITFMSNLNSLNLRNNNLHGMIPTVIAALTNLEFLQLSNTHLNGTIPTEIGMLTKLDFIDLDGNSLHGSIPSELGLLNKLETIWLYNNILTGTIPVEFNSLQNLGRLGISQNRINGTIPLEICELVVILLADCDEVVCNCCLNSDWYPCPISPTAVPSAVPSQSSSPTVTSQPTISPTLSMLPTMTAAPTETIFYLSIIIQLDQYPMETSWELTCNDTIIQLVNYQSYTMNYMVVNETFNISFGSICTFHIFDLDRSGIYGGYYNILINNQIIISEDGNFGWNDEKTFMVDYPPPTNSPSVPPTMTVAPTPLIAFITISIILEGEIGWNLECDNILISTFPVGIYDVLSISTTALPVPYGALCNFTISNNIEISNSTYQIFVGEDSSGIDGILLKEGFNIIPSDNEYIFVASPYRGG